MNASAARLSQAVVGAVLAVSVVTALALATAAPTFLLLDEQASRSAFWSGLRIGGPAILLSCMLTWIRLHRYRFTIRALGLGARPIEAEDLLALDDVPFEVAVTVTSIAVGATSLTLLPPLRAEGIDLDTTVSLVLLTYTFCATGGLSLHVIVRRLVAAAIQLAPEDAMAEMIERARATRHPQRRVVRRVLIAVVMPVALVGFGIALLAHAHVRAYEARARMATATALAQASLEPVPGPLPTAGEMAAAAAAMEYGYHVKLLPSTATFSVERKTSGEVTMTVPLDLGHARIAFAGTTVLALTTSGIIAAFLASALAAALGGLIGRSLAEDLSQATRQVHLLGTDLTLRGVTRVARPARFAVVASLGEGIEKLALRFGVFANIQEKAIEARESARRMRGLLFASVSHDFKSCLNAILGFADLVDEAALGPGQRESLDVIKFRGRLLLRLIQTILDAARVEAGQLVLNKRNTRLDELIESAIQSAQQLVEPQDAARVVSDVHDGNWHVVVDPPRIVDALATLTRHALRTTVSGEIRISAARSPSGEEVLVDVAAPTRSIPADRLAVLLLPDGDNTMPRAAGGLALGLSLARSLIVLHDGSVRAMDTRDGVVLRVTLPIAPSDTVRPTAVRELS